MPQKYVYVFVCVHPVFLLNCECNSAGMSQSGLSRAGDPEKEQTAMEEEKGGRNLWKKGKSDIYRYEDNDGTQQRMWTERLVDKVCVFVCVCTMLVRIQSSSKTCLFADKTHISSISLLYNPNVSNSSQCIYLLLHSFIFSTHFLQQRGEFGEFTCFELTDGQIKKIDFLCSWP